MFSLSSVSRNFFISLLIYSVSCWLFINLLFNLHVFVSLTVVFFVFFCFFLVVDIRHLEGSIAWGPSLVFSESGT